MRNIFFGALLFMLANLMPASINKSLAAGPDDAILILIAEWFNKAANIIKIVGEGFLAELRLRGDKALISAKKNNVTSISKALAEQTSQELNRYALDNSGVSGRVASVRYDARGRRIYDLFWVSSIAPSGCIAKSKSKAFRSLVEGVSNFRGSLQEKYDSSTLTKANDNTSQKLAKEQVIINDVYRGMKKHQFGLFPSKYKAIEANDELTQYMSSLAALFSFKETPLNLKQAEQNDVNNMIQSNKGHSWLGYQLMVEGLYSVVTSGFDKNIIVDNDGSPTTQSKEELKSYHYANSFKRTLASQVKSSTGNIMEINYLLNRILESKIKEHDDLLKQQILLEIISVKRVHQYRSEF